MSCHNCTRKENNSVEGVTFIFTFERELIKQFKFYVFDGARMKNVCEKHVWK